MTKKTYTIEVPYEHVVHLFREFYYWGIGSIYTIKSTEKNIIITTTNTDLVDVVTEVFKKNMELVSWSTRWKLSWQLRTTNSVSTHS
jgi:hypothetical protein